MFLNKTFKPGKLSLSMIEKIVDLDIHCNASTQPNPIVSKYRIYEQILGNDVDPNQLASLFSKQDIRW